MQVQGLCTTGLGETSPHGGSCWYLGVRSRLEGDFQ